MKNLLFIIIILLYASCSSIKNKERFIDLGIGKEKLKQTQKTKILKKGISFTQIYRLNKKKTEPFQISILKINLKEFKGTIFSCLANNKVKGREKVSLIAKRNNALAAVNAGFFVTKNEQGIDGDIAGISIIDGKLVSEAINGRPALIIDNNSSKKMYIAHNVQTKIKLELKDTIFNANGINRLPGKILNCGNITHSLKSTPIHDYVCKNPNEIIIYDKNFGNFTPKGKGIELIIENNKITSIFLKRGNYIPKNGYSIQVIGKHIKNILKYFTKNTKVLIDFKVVSDEGLITLKKGLYAVNGGPTLLRKGIISFSDIKKEGWNDSKIHYNWINHRHPRTAIGITKNNIAYVIVIYGRQPQKSLGATIAEMSKIFKKLGVDEALNLDGGGSSIMIVKNEPTGIPSDKNGERPVGDALIFK